MKIAYAASSNFRHISAVGD